MAGQAEAAAATKLASESCDGEGEDRGREMSPFVIGEVKSRPSAYPDGGFGWVIVGACFFGQFLYTLPLYYGFFYIELLDQFGWSKSKTALVGSLSYAVGLFICPFAGLLCDRFGHRPINILGNIIMCVGFLISAYASSLGLLCFSYGCVVGIGSGLQWISPGVFPSFYFDKRRNLAFGIAGTGNSVGEIALPVLIQCAIHQYTWRGAMVVVACFPLQNCVSGALLWRNKNLSSNKPTGHSNMSYEAYRVPVMSTLKDAKLAVAFAIFCTDGVAVSIYYTMFPDRMVEFGYSADQAAFLQSMCGVTTTVSRLGFGMITTWWKIDNIISLTVMNFGAVVCHLILAFGSASYGLQAFGILLEGAFRGVQLLLRALWILQIFGVKMMTRALGFILFSLGIGSVIGPPIAGLIFEMYGSYRYAFLLSGASSLLSGLLNIPIYHMYKQSQKDTAAFSDCNLDD